jgi:ubiquinone/menaquinone biosynthesis C-methylase UbiE
MRAMTTASNTLFLCPRCSNPLPVRPPCACGFVLRESAGIIDLLTDNDAAAIRPFLEAYERVRLDEQWGGDDLDLPFHPKRHQHIWDIRQRTFKAFQSVLSDSPRGLALDIGAGNCWLTRYLDRWGFDAIALDVNTSPIDGLRAGQKFIDEGSVFLRVRGSMERLPFDSGRIRLVAANASFHYASDFRAALSEFERVLTPGGIVAIIDSPVYESPADGDHMVSQRVDQFRRKYGIAESLARQSSYVTYQQLQALASSLALEVRVHHVWPGLRRKWQEFRGTLVGRRIAKFPLVLLEKRGRS